MITQGKTIAIVGGGPGGLTLARLLQMHGVTVTVFERDFNKDARVQGATLDLHDESGLKALRQAGLFDAFKANYRPGADKVRLVDKHATIIFDDHAGPDQETFGHEAFRPEIDRGPLRKILLESLASGTVVWNSQFLSMTQVEGAWKLDFQNGTSALADIVVAADGANSKIRPFITPIKPFYAGITVVEGNVYNAETTAPAIYTLLKGGKIFAIDDNKTLIVSSKGDGSLAFYTGCRTDEHWAQTSGINFADNAQVLAWFKQEFSDWSSVWWELFTTDQAQFTPRPQYCMPVDQTWDALSNLTMLGDAAHLMPPYAGEGVNMAMLDALELSNCLTNASFPDVKTAIRTYEEQMRARASETAQLTLEQTKVLHSEGAMAAMMAIFA